MSGEIRFRGSAAIRLLVAALLALAAVPLLGVGPAQACSCDGQSDKQSAKTAVAVFTGALIDTELPPPAEIQSSDDPVTYTFAVDRVYKGSVTDPQRVRSIVGSDACGLELRGNGPFLVFGAEPRGNRNTAVPATPGEGLLSAFLCGGTRTVKATEKLPFGKGTAPVPVAASTDATTPSATVPTSSDDDLPGWALPLGIIVIAGAAGLGVAAVDRSRKAT